MYDIEGTLRDLFAGSALGAMARELKSREDSQVGLTADEIAERAFELADAMMRRRVV